MIFASFPKFPAANELPDFVAYCRKGVYQLFIHLPPPQIIQSNAFFHLYTHQKTLFHTNRRMSKLWTSKHFPFALSNLTDDLTEKIANCFTISVEQHNRTKTQRPGAITGKADDNPSINKQPPSAAATEPGNENRHSATTFTRLWTICQGLCQNITTHFSFETST